MANVSRHIIDASEDVEIINLESRGREINGELYLVIIADVASQDRGVYRSLIYRSKYSGRDWSSCNCSGFYYTSMCKHLYHLEEREHNPITRESYRRSKNDTND
jgi:hypothetical protein